VRALDAVSLGRQLGFGLDQQLQFFNAEVQGLLREIDRQSDGIAAGALPVPGEQPSLPERAPSIERMQCAISV
jgi:hypothetical protein